MEPQTKGRGGRRTAPYAFTEQGVAMLSSVLRSDRAAEVRNGKRISIIYGPKYTVAIIYAPPGQNFICFEPMSAITNTFNLSHRGIYKELQSVPPGGTWRESFWIETSGF